MNAPPPVPLSLCKRLVDGHQRPGGSIAGPDALGIAHGFLRSNWPWLAKTGQDLEGYLANLGIIIEAHSAAAVRHVVNPMTGPEWENDRPPSPQAFRRALAAYEARQTGLVVAAQRILAEADRRAAEADLEARIAADRKALLQRTGGDPLAAILREAGK